MGSYGLGNSRNSGVGYLADFTGKVNKLNEMKYNFDTKPRDILKLLLVVVVVSGWWLLLSSFPLSHSEQFPDGEKTQELMKCEGLEKFEIIEASWYDEKHCLGCRDDRLMANGEKLDGSKMTAAYNKFPLNTKLKVRRADKEIEVVITDRVGIDRIDLTREAFRLLEPNLDKGIIKVGVVRP